MTATALPDPLVPAAVAATATVLGMPLAIDGATPGFSRELTVHETAPGVAIATLVLSAAEPLAPSPLRLVFRLPAIDVAGVWRPNGDHHKGIIPSWASGMLTAKATSQAPVLCAFGQGDGNRLTVACGDALHPVVMDLGIVEETGEFHGAVALFTTPRAAAARFTVELRFDRRDVYFARALGDVAAWWAAVHRPAVVPEVGRRPMYSTWYSFHQAVEPAAVLAQCVQAKALGCDAVIVDDGWQTLDGSRGYAFCGDWAPERIPDMRGFVADVHRAGMAFILWYAVSFVGYGSAVYARFADKVLRRDERLKTAILDPRYPEVRDYLIGTWETALRAWDLDGFKLDFVDAFCTDAATPPEARNGVAGAGRDYADIDEAVDRLLADTLRRLRALKPDILIEFRQSYIGPLMRTYGNLLRAGDCPDDALTNRVRTIDIRLLCGDTAAHADMVMWHPDEPVDSAALQLLNVLFAVPQLSVRLDRITAEQREMTAFWTAWWNRHRDVLLDGVLEPRQPGHHYPVVLASTPAKRVVAVYSEAIAETGPEVPATLLLVNATRRARLVLELAEDLGPRAVTVRDCRGRVVHEGHLDLRAGVHRLTVPPAGVIELIS